MVLMTEKYTSCEVTVLVWVSNLRKNCMKFVTCWHLCEDSWLGEKGEEKYSITKS